jgi:hypothetical protein
MHAGGPPPVAFPRRGNHHTKQEQPLNFFDQIHETQITRPFRQPRLAPLRTPLHRRLFAVDQSRHDARAAAR